MTIIKISPRSQELHIRDKESLIRLGNAKPREIEMLDLDCNVRQAVA